ncbi:MAG: DUF5710 domain-containing protein [Rickettsia endosymbiont of Oxypoda opaca]|nr:DUF5710 domain-containing protein [Rickettsia endosymbiont of Oxypoda opaca]
MSIIILIVVFLLAICLVCIKKVRVKNFKYLNKCISKKSQPSFSSKQQIYNKQSSITTQKLTAREAFEESKRQKENPNVVYRKIHIPKDLEGKINPDTLWEDLYKAEINECVELVKKQVKYSQASSLTEEPMIPLCLPYHEKDNIKRLGGVWDSKLKTWFWSFDRDAKLVEKWLPKIYKSNITKAIILPRLVPESLWYINLRSLLPQKEWDFLRKSIYEESGYRCTICGCKGAKWPVECDEIWLYDDNYSSKYGMIHFQGLQSLCPSCHKVCHFGKARVDNEDGMATARIMALNNWSFEKTQEVIEHAFNKWKARSEKEWLFNFDILEQKYGIDIKETSYLKKISEA